MRAFTADANLNGLGPERELELARLKSEGMAPLAQHSNVAEDRIPFGEAELAVIRQIIIERDKSPECFFDPRDSFKLAKEFKLVHLRWLLKQDGYEKHWEYLSRRMAEYPAQWLEMRILRDRVLGRLWQAHTILNGGEEEAVAALEQWKRKSAAASDEQRKATLIEQYALLFHHQFARKRFASCAQIARLAGAIVSENDNGIGRRLGAISHPYQEMVTMPVGHPLYWRYLEAQSSLESLNDDSGPDESSIALLFDAEALSTSFRSVDDCFWRQFEEYEGGGGDDYERAPYDIDLRDTEPWRLAIEALLRKVPTTDRADLLAALAAKLATADRPFAPEPLVFDVFPGLSEPLRKPGSPLP